MVATKNLKKLVEMLIFFLGGAFKFKSGDPSKYPFRLPLQKPNQKHCDFSFAGLKTAVRLTYEKELERLRLETNEQGVRVPGQLEADIAASFQQVAIMHLIERTERAVQWAKEVCTHRMLLVDIRIMNMITVTRQVESRPIRTLVIAGGVAANSRVREAMSHLARRNNLQLAVPTPSLCTDNGVMVAWAGVENYNLDRFKVIFPLPVQALDLNMAALVHIRLAFWSCAFAGSSTSR